MFCHKMRRLQLGPEIHPAVLFLHEVLKQTRNIDTFGGDSFQNFFHTSTWNVINNFSYSTVEILWSDLVNTTIRCGELVNCKSLPVSSTARPACLGSKGTTKSNHVESIFSTTATSSSKMSSSLILKRLLGLAFWPALFKKKNFFHIEQWFAVNLPDGQTAMWDGSNLNCLPAAKQSEHWPILREIWKVETCFVSQKFGLQESTSTPATTQVCNSLGWFNWTMPHPGKILWTWSSVLPVSPRTFAQVLRTLQPANWTLKIDLTVLHFDGTITNHKEIGLGRLLPS